MAEFQVAAKRLSIFVSILYYHDKWSFQHSRLNPTIEKTSPNCNIKLTKERGHQLSLPVPVAIFVPLWAPAAYIDESSSSLELHFWLT